MNVKEIAQAVGKDERSVQRWAKKVGDKVSSINDKVSSSTSTHPAEYNLDETCMIIEQGLGKNAGALFRSNAEFTSANAKASGSVNTNSRLDRIESILEKIIEFQVALMPVKQQDPIKQIALAPKITARAEIRKIINHYCADNKNFAETWNRLYEEIYYRLGCNVSVCASNRGMDRMDYLEREGMIEDALLIAREIFG